MHAEETASRTALTQFAARSGTKDDRPLVASGLLAGALAERLKVSPAVVGVGRPPRTEDWTEELAELSNGFKLIGDWYKELLEGGRVPVTVSSSCSMALSTLPAVVRHRPDVVVVWMDAHINIHTPETAPNGHLREMTVAAALGLWPSGLGAGLAPGNVVFAGSRDVDEVELETAISKGATLVSPGPRFAERLKAAVAGRPVYLHLDCDVLEPGLVPATREVPGGISLEDLKESAAALSESEVVGLDIAELLTEREGPAMLQLMSALEPITQHLD